jgi:hypothetical protein
MALEIRPSTTKQGEYAIYKDGRRTPQGLLSYKWDAAALRAIDTSRFEGDSLWTVEPIDEANKLRLLPYTLKPADWRLIAVVKIMRGETAWLKGALINNTTGKVALITSASSEGAINERTIKSHDAIYHIGHYGMLAPILFWDTMKAGI